MGCTGGKPVIIASTPPSHHIEMTKTEGGRCATITFAEKDPEEVFLRFNLNADAGADFKIKLEHESA